MIAAPMLYAAALAAGFCLTTDAAAASFRLASADIKPGGTIASERIFNGFGCSGQNVSPALEWTAAPKDTKSFALLVHDPETLCFICGPSTLVDEMPKRLVELGIPPARIRIEEWGPPATST